LAREEINRVAQMGYRGDKKVWTATLADKLRPLADDAILRKVLFNMVGLELSSRNLWIPEAVCWYSIMQF